MGHVDLQLLEIKRTPWNHFHHKIKAQNQTNGSKKKLNRGVEGWNIKNYLLG